MSILVECAESLHHYPEGVPGLRVRIKICGITTPEIARHAVTAGADAIGLNFYPKSSRYLSIGQAVEVADQIAPFVARVGVFVNPDRDVVQQIVDAVHLDYFQFHGEESANFCASFGIPYIKSIRVTESTDLLALENQYHDAVALLLDSHSSDSYGGTGKSFDWNKSRYGGEKNIILAGGLTADNIQSAIKAVSPYAVDVSSGVETDGVKDTAKITEFCNRVQCV